MRTANVTGEHKQKLQQLPYYCDLWRSKVQCNLCLENKIKEVSHDDNTDWSSNENSDENFKRLRNTELFWTL